MGRIAIDYGQLATAVTTINTILNNDVSNMESELKGAATEANSITLAPVNVSPAQNAVSVNRDELIGLRERIHDLVETTHDWDTRAAARLQAITLGLDVRFDANGNLMAADWASMVEKLSMREMENIFGAAFVQEVTDLFRQLGLLGLFPMERERIINQLVDLFMSLPIEVLENKEFKSHPIVMRMHGAIYTFRYSVNIALIAHTPEGKALLRINLTEQLNQLSLVASLGAFSVNSSGSISASGGSLGSVSMNPFLLLLGVVNITFAPPRVDIENVFYLSSKVEITGTPDLHPKPQKQPVKKVADLPHQPIPSLSPVPASAWDSQGWMAVDPRYVDIGIEWPQPSALETALGFGIVLAPVAFVVWPAVAAAAPVAAPVAGELASALGRG